ncbi:MAG: 2-C-methyl-D-erythritol 4-phosphate cytidylyltransferase [Clostridiales Family XIII bacterium]|jgi:2-C-methyl-D-erythritol 4-phosphate cytidylyltransferase|nr:2-C-methyl-D-erythritol 4-phosphate cytidylyltransferase [Clostridiales Family XIII bacterium]
MIYAAVLAAGLGVRMHRRDLPKQFLPLGEKPILIHTLERFCAHPRVDKILIVAPDAWKAYTEDLLAGYDSMGKEVTVLSGGANKSESIGIAVECIEERWGIGERDTLIAHDAIRPFVTQRIIDDNIDAAEAHGAANTAMRTNDAILVSEDGLRLSEVPDHNRMYAEQTPQTYNLRALKEALSWAAENGRDLRGESELPRLFVQSGHEMRLVRGEHFNMKIINPHDLEVANALLRERGGA